MSTTSSAALPTRSPASPLQSAFFRFPPEVLHLIFSHIAIDCDPESGFHLGIARANEIALRSLPLASFALYPVVREALFAYVWLGTERRINKFLQTLDLSVYRRGEVIKGYLRRFVKGVRIELMERQVGLDGRNVGGQVGVTTEQVLQLAKLLPDLRSLDVVVNDTGSRLDPMMAAATRQFKSLKELELHGSSIGFANAQAVFAGQQLTTLKLGTIVPDHSGPFVDGANFIAHTPPPAFHSTLTVLTLFQCQLRDEQFDAIFASLPSLHTLTLFQLQGVLLLPPPMAGVPAPPPQTIPFPPTKLITALTPLIPHLISLTLFLFDRAPIANNGPREAAYKAGLLLNGRLTLPTADLRLADELSPHFPPTLTHVTLGGPLCLSPTFFSRLPCAGITDLFLTNCANVHEPWTSSPDGVDPSEVVEALDMGWAKGLRRIELKGMEDTTLDGRPLWDWEGMEAVRRKMGELARERGEGGGLGFKTDLKKPKENKGSAFGGKRVAAKGETVSRKKSKK